CSWKGCMYSLGRGGNPVVQNSGGGGDPEEQVPRLPSAVRSLAVRVQARLINAYIPQRLQRVCGVSQRRSQPIVTRCLRAALMLRRSMRKTSAIQEAWHQPPLTQ